MLPEPTCKEPVARDAHEQPTDAGAVDVEVLLEDVLGNAPDQHTSHRCASSNHKLVPVVSVGTPPGIPMHTLVEWGAHARQAKLQGERAAQVARNACNTVYC